MTDPGLVEERRQFTARIRDLEQRHAALIDALAVLIATAHCEPDMTLVVEVGDLERLLRQYRERR